MPSADIDAGARAEEIWKTESPPNQKEQKLSDLLKLLQIESGEINLRFAKASIEGRGTPQEVADRRENVVQRFMAKYFPFPFRIAKGNIVDGFGGRSASIDCIVLNPEHPHTVSESQLYSVILADGTDFAIEVKPDLNSQNEIERALKQIASVKALTRSENKKPISGYQHKIPCVIFSNTTFADPTILLNYITDYYERENLKRINQFDFIVINNRLLIVNIRHGSYFWPLAGDPEGYVILDSAENTLAAMLMFLNGMPLSRTRINESVLTNYIHDEDLGPSRWVAEINERLDKLESQQ